MKPRATRVCRWAADLHLTPADRVTVLRAGLGVGCALLVALAFLGYLPERNWPLFLLAVLTALLDAVDGAVARRTGTVTQRGSRWDLEVDSAFILVLSLALVPVVPMALGIGMMRYLFWLGGRMRPGWDRPLPFRQSRRIIAALQAVALVTALAPFVPEEVARGVVAAALVLLGFSFVRDVRFLERHGT